MANLRNGICKSCHKVFNFYYSGRGRPQARCSDCKPSKAKKDALQAQTGKVWGKLLRPWFLTKGKKNAARWIGRPRRLLVVYPHGPWFRCCLSNIGGNGFPEENHRLSSIKAEIVKVQEALGWAEKIAKQLIATYREKS